VGFTIAEDRVKRRPLTAPLLAELLDDVVAVSERSSARRSSCWRTLEARLEARCGALAASLQSRRSARRWPAVAISPAQHRPTLLISVMRHGLTHAGRSLVLRSVFPIAPAS